MTHVYAGSKIVRWLEDNLYHPRSNKHGRILCRYFLDDLLHISPIFRICASQGRVVFAEDIRIGQDPLSWTVDLVVGPPSQHRLGDINWIERGIPNKVWLAIDAKSVMTEHRKARRNRQRDLNSLASIVKEYHPNSVVGGLMLVNNAARFKSPLRDEVTIHRNIDKLVDVTVQMFGEIPRADNAGERGIEAVGVIVVDHTNLPGERSYLTKEYPAPKLGDISNYQTSLEIIKKALEHRFLS